jgi:hypothetical protein
MNDFNNGTRKVKTPEDWAEDIERETSGALGRWAILPREIFSSKAYRALSLPEREVLLCYLNKVQYTPSKKDRKGVKKSRAVPENGNHLIVTNNEIKARGGIRSDKTISEARKRIVEIGFLDVVQPSAFPHPGIFALSTRFKNFPSKDYKPKDAKPVSFARYSRACPSGSNRFDTQQGRTTSEPLAGSVPPGNLINDCTRYSEELRLPLYEVQL